MSNHRRVAALSGDDPIDRSPQLVVGNMICVYLYTDVYSVYMLTFGGVSSIETT